jgi:hypothetical protein
MTHCACIHIRSPSVVIAQVNVSACIQQPVDLTDILSPDRLYDGFLYDIQYGFISPFCNVILHPTIPL